MKQRIITGIVMALILGPLFVLGGYFSVAMIAFLSYVGTYELLNMYQKKYQIPSFSKYLIPLFSVSMVLASGILSGLESFVFIILILGIEFVVLLVLTLFIKNFRFKDSIFFMFATVYSGVTFAIMEYTRNLDKLISHIDEGAPLKVCLFNQDFLNIHPIGLIMLSFILVVVFLTDIGALAVGRRVGKRKLCPTISPKKTIEGAIGGVIFGALAGTLYTLLLMLCLNDTAKWEVKLFLIDNDWIYLLTVFAISIVISIAGQLGDLVASKLKREFEIKDYGNIFPGHGGVLDRFDSTIFGVIVFYIIYIIIMVFTKGLL